MQRVSFTPNDISTPRSSCASDDSVNPRMSVEKISQSLAEDLEFLSDRVRNSDISLVELCDEFHKRTSFSQEFNDESFASGELAAAKIAAHEESWRKERATLGGNIIKSDSIFSQLDNPSFNAEEGSISVTEFFRKKSELAELCLKDSPEKETSPTPLVDKSFKQPDDTTNLHELDFSESSVLNFIQQSSSSSFDNSVLSISEIEKVISPNDNTTKIMNYMTGKSRKTDKPKESLPEKHFKTKSVPSLEVKNGNDLKENQLFKGCSSNSKCRSSCMKPLKDSGHNIMDKSVGSLRTVSSLDSLPGGKLPLETNKIELVWGCVPVGARKIQTFILRNRSQNKLRLQLSSSSTNFKILRDHSEADPVQILPVLLHPSESRLFSVMFSPANIGAMAERINFSPVSTELQSKQTKRQQLNVFGYGGYAQLEILDIPKDVNLKMWLSLGKIIDLPGLKKKFVIRNTGSLAAFAHLSFGSKALFECSKTVNVYPTEVVIKPNEEKSIKVSYTPTKDELQHLLAVTKSQVIEIGYIQIISGEEPLRGRIRRLCRKLKKEAGSVANPLIEKLSNSFHDERMPSDIHKLTETVGSMKELMQNLVSKEVILTLERGLEGSLFEHIAGIDETSMFHSLVEGMVTTICASHVNACTVEPTNIVLTPPSKTEDNVLVINQTAQLLQFQTALTNDEILEVSPSEGMLPPGQTILLRINCDTRKLQQQQQKLFKLSIFVDDDVFDVDIKIVLIKPTCNLIC